MFFKYNLYVYIEELKLFINSTFSNHVQTFSLDIVREFENRLRGCRDETDGLFWERDTHGEASCQADTATDPIIQNLSSSYPSKDDDEAKVYLYLYLLFQVSWFLRWKLNILYNKSYGLISGPHICITVGHSHELSIISSQMSTSKWW